jgi:hypothetical protein
MKTCRFELGALLLVFAFFPAAAQAQSVFRLYAGIAPTSYSISFDNNKPTIDRDAAGKAVTNATFSAPGDYILRVEGNDSTGSGGGGFQCCWSNAHVSVTVK